MAMSSQELSELKARVLVAMRTGTNIARVSDYTISLIREAGSSLPERAKSDSDVAYLYSSILAVESKREQLGIEAVVKVDSVPIVDSEPDAVQVKRRDKFIKDAVSKGKFTMSVAQSSEELAEQLVADLKAQKSFEEAPVIELTKEMVKDASVEPVIKSTPEVLVEEDSDQVDTDNHESDSIEDSGQNQHEDAPKPKGAKPKKTKK